jgi:hypothetical protein
MVALAAGCFFLLRPLKEQIEHFLYEHHPYHVDVSYYRPESPGDLVFRHRMDQLSLDYRREPRFSRWNDEAFLARWRGWLRVPDDGKYTFEVSCEEHAVLYLMDAPLVDNQRALDIGKIRMGVATNLNAGMYSFRLEHEHRTGDAWMKVKWKRGDSKPKVLRAPYVRGCQNTEEW